ncbi:KTSC domain-containing protein [Brevundimonas sp. NPDC092305]|uniref:KTSC domain-containing protein n=1 Tax=Brevundimonas sp. NPDC092305 TaxID=3363957 RepID=UPI00382E8F04
MPSSVIRRFSYDEPHRRLRVVFTSGDVYDYDRVPPDVVEDLRAAPSKGRFFGPNIRTRYPYRRVDRSPEHGRGV